MVRCALFHWLSSYEAVIWNIRNCAYRDRASTQSSVTYEFARWGRPTYKRPSIEVTSADLMITSSMGLRSDRGIPGPCPKRTIRSGRLDPIPR